MQPDMPEHADRPRQSPLDDLRERLARLPASHPSAPGYRDWPGDAGGPPEPARPEETDGPDEPAAPDDAAGPGETDPAADGEEPEWPDPAGPEEARGAGPPGPGRAGRPDGTAVRQPLAGGDGGREPYRPWFSGEAPRPWFSDGPAGRSG